MRIKRLLSPQDGPATSQFTAVTVFALVVAFAGISIGAAAQAQEKSLELNPAFRAPLQVSGDIAARQIISRINPLYPREAKSIQGEVVLHATISREGDVTNLQVVGGPEELRKSAITAVSQWKYKPYLFNGQPVDIETNITVNYTHNEDDRTDSGVMAKKVGNGVSAPKVISQMVVQFTQSPKVAIKAGDFHGGSVLVHLIVDERGNPQKVHIVRVLGYGLDDDALKAVQQYRFVPALEKGKPVPVATNLEVAFKVY